ncbi:hypothetical protein ACLOJK_004740 [Asimina triloba]
MVNDPSSLVGSLRKILPEQRTQASLPSSTNRFRPSTSRVVCGKDIISTAGDLIFFFSTMAPKKSQSEERSPPHNAVDARPLHAASAPPPEDRVLSNSPDPSRESLNGQVTRAEFHALMKMIKFLQQQMVHARPDTTSIPSAASTGVPSPMTTFAMTPDMAPIAHHPQATSQPYSSPTLRAPDLNSSLALHLKVQPIPDVFLIPEMAIFGPTSDPTRYVVNYNIHMDLHTTSKGLKCRAFPATMDEQGKMWFASLAPGPITSFR